MTYKNALKIIYTFLYRIKLTHTLIHMKTNVMYFNNKHRVRKFDIMHKNRT